MMLAEMQKPGPMRVAIGNHRRSARFVPGLTGNLLWDSQQRHSFATDALGLSATWCARPPMQWRRFHQRPR